MYEFIQFLTRQNLGRATNHTLIQKVGQSQICNQRRSLPYLPFLSRLFNSLYNVQLIICFRSTKWFQMVGDGWMGKAVGDKFLPLTSAAFITGAFSLSKLPLTLVASHISCFYDRCLLEHVFIYNSLSYILLYILL